LRSTTRTPSPPRPGRTAALVAFLSAALALAGAGTASAAASGPVTSQARTATHVALTRQDAAKHPESRQIVTTAALAPRRATADQSAAHQSLNTWGKIAHAIAGQPRGPLPASERLLPTSMSGPQSFLPMTAAREANATTIVRQALAKHMGLRSAVIAVATAMQESQLLNIDYGTYDSLGLFQQQPDMGWGTAAQVTDPVYASDAFLDALHGYQVSNPNWAVQPLWQAAQGVQKSAYPYAYAQWEDQAAHVVAGIARDLAH
jgi:hypothetical protein